MRKLSRFHVAVALLAVLSVVSLLGASLVVTQAVPAGFTGIFATKPVEVTVWWYEDPYGWLGLGIGSADYNSWGRTYMHLMMSASGLLSGEQIEVWVYGKLWDAAKTSAIWVEAGHYYLSYDYPDYETVLYVPSSKFSFWAKGPSGSDISLSFYMSGS